MSALTGIVIAAHGRHYLADVAGSERLPYRFVDRPGMVAIQTRAGMKTPVEVSAEILATLRQRAEDSFDADELFGAVITVCRPTSTTRSARRPRTLRNSPA